VVDRVEEPEVTSQLERRRAAAAAAWGLTDAVVVIGAGNPIPVPGRGDLTYPFRAHSDYYYLTDRNAPGWVLVFDPHQGWLELHPPLGTEAALWLGTPTQDDDGLSTDSLPDWLASRPQRSVACLGVAPDDVAFDAELSEELRFALARVRRPKDSVELQRMRVAEQATRAAFATAAGMLQDGVSERAVQIELEAQACRAGADAMAYDTIVASGPNSAALHFAPTSRVLRSGELLLIDAGAEYRGYDSDITRTYPVSGSFTSEQQELHSLVRTAELTAIDRCLPGTEWREVHLAAALVIAEGLSNLGILRGGPEALIESGAVWLFFPHGVGHLVGLGIRDAGGTLAERRNNPPPFPHLRINLPLESGMVVTVEPGIYFVPALLGDPDRRHRHREQVTWDRVDRMLDFGGIRIEDNVLITDSGHEVMTADVPLL